MTIFEKAPYLKGIIKALNKDHTRFECILCINNQPSNSRGEKTVTVGKKSLKDHILAKSHRKFTAFVESSVDALEKAMEIIWTKIDKDDNDETMIIEDGNTEGTKKINYNTLN